MELTNFHPQGIGYEWTGISLQEKQSESQMIFLIALSMLVVLIVMRPILKKISFGIPLNIMANTAPKIPKGTTSMTRCSKKKA
jgi:multidrug efflux pump subunit AcrB